MNGKDIRNIKMVKSWNPKGMYPYYGPDQCGIIIEYKSETIRNAIYDEINKLSGYKKIARIVQEIEADEINKLRKHCLRELEIAMDYLLESTDLTAEDALNRIFNPKNICVKLFNNQN